MGNDVERQLGEAGVPPAMSSELAELAKDIEALPQIEPRRAWATRSKQQLLRRFDEQHGDAETGRPDS